MGARTLMRTCEEQGNDMATEALQGVGPRHRRQGTHPAEAVPWGRRRQNDAGIMGMARGWCGTLARA